MLNRLFAVVAMGVAFVTAPSLSATTGARDDSGTRTTVSERSIGDIQRTVNTQPDNFAGVVLDRSASTVTVYVTSSHESAARSALRPFQAIGAADLSAGLRLEIVPVPRSLSELNGAMAQVTTRQPWASQAADVLSAWYVDPRADKVHVGLTTVTPAIRAAAAQAFGDAVELVQQPRFVSAAKHDTVRADQIKIQRAAAAQQPKAAIPRGSAAGDGGVGPLDHAPVPSRLEDQRPFYGGDRIVWWYTDNSGVTHITQCTVAFDNYSSAGDVMSTAGHCGPTGRIWYQGWFNEQDQAIYTQGTMGTDTSTQWGNNRMDAEILSYGSYGPAVYESVVGGTTVAGDGLLSVGEDICTDGSFTLENCSAKIDAIDGCVVLDGTYNVCNQAIAESINGSRIVNHGDSGGPVYHLDSSFNALALGIISGGNPDEGGTFVNFTQENSFESAFGVAVRSGI